MQTAIAELLFQRLEAIETFGGMLLAEAKHLRTIIALEQQPRLPLQDAHEPTATPQPEGPTAE